MTDRPVADTEPEDAYDASDPVHIRLAVITDVLDAIANEPDPARRAARRADIRRVLFALRAELGAWHADADALYDRTVDDGSGVEVEPSRGDRRIGHGDDLGVGLRQPAGGDVGRAPVEQVVRATAGDEQRGERDRSFHDASLPTPDETDGDDRG